MEPGQPRMEADENVPVNPEKGITEIKTPSVLVNV
jgi:hypothetical protein